MTYKITPPGEPKMSWNCNALTEDNARFQFVQRWGGLMVSRDLRPSELKVEVTTERRDVG